MHETFLLEKMGDKTYCYSVQELCTTLNLLETEATRVFRLCLIGFKISKADALRLNSLFEKSKAVGHVFESMWWSSNALTDEVFELLLTGQSETNSIWKMLRVLEIANQHLTSKGLEMLKKCVCQSNLETLIISDMRKLRSGGERSGRLLAEIIQEQHKYAGTLNKLSCLKFCESYLGDIGVKEFCRTLAQNDFSGLQMLFFENTKLTSKAAKELADFLPQSNLKTLSLFENSIDDEGLVAIVSVLPRSKLISLNVGKNNFSEAGTPVMINMIKHSLLKHLCLSQLGLNDQTGILLAEALRDNHSLQLLDLSSNVYFTDEVGKALIKATKTHRSLLTVDLSFIPISNSIIFELKSQLERLHDPISKLLVMFCSARTLNKTHLTSFPVRLLSLDLLRKLVVFLRGNSNMKV